MNRRPNVLVVMTDEERFPPPYEVDALADWRREALPAREALRARSLELRRHYTGSTACPPSRATLFTGQYPSLHGVRSTDGLAKSSSDPAMSWLDPDTVPTMGDWFRAGGYETQYRGKWHVSHPDLLRPGSHEALLTNDRDGNLVTEVLEAYRHADRLDPFGFGGWIGPEPHGPHPANTGYVRDGLLADQVVELFADLARRADDGPWLTVASFVNPHDIAFSGFGWQTLGFPDPPDSVPDIPRAPSQDDDLSARPSAQAGFRDTWPRMLYPQPADLSYRRLYHWLHQLVDVAIGRILDALEDSGMADDTVVVFTSDHGDLLGAHGGLQQKWHVAYDEAIHVPMLVSGPGIDVGRDDVEMPTSHVDVLPTLLGLAGIDRDEAAAVVSRDHFETHPLPGRDLSALLAGTATEADLDTPIYFNTEDRMTEGLGRVGLGGETFDPVAQPANIESVIARLPSTSGSPELWKLNRSYDQSPDSVPDQWELSNLTADPEERRDRSGDAPGNVRELLTDLLVEQRAAKRRIPRLRNA